MELEDDPIEEDNDPLEKLSSQTKTTIQQINRKMKHLEHEWKELKKMKHHYTTYLSHLQNSIVSRLFMLNANETVERLIIPNQYIETQEEEEIVPTQKCN